MEYNRQTSVKVFDGKIERVRKRGIAGGGCSFPQCIYLYKSNVSICTKIPIGRKKEKKSGKRGEKVRKKIILLTESRLVFL